MGGAAAEPCIFACLAGAVDEFAEFPDPR